MIAVTDDWHHRIVVIDPHTKRIVWSYGHLGVARHAPATSTSRTGSICCPAAAPGRRAAPRVGTRRRAAAAGHPDRVACRRLSHAICGRACREGVSSLRAGSSAARRPQVLTGPPGHLASLGPPAHAGPRCGGRARRRTGSTCSAAGRRPRPTPSFASIRRRGRRRVRRISTSRSRTSARRSSARTPYLVGGYTGSRFASAVLRYLGAGRTTTAARLPAGLRYAGVAALGGKIYVAGGLTTAGETTAVYAVDPRTGRSGGIATLPTPSAYGRSSPSTGRPLPDRRQDGRRDAARHGSPHRPGIGTRPAVATLPRPLAEPAAVARAGDVIVVGGENSNAVYRLG